MTFSQDLDADYVLHVLQREGDGAFYYRKPGELQLFRTRASAISAIRQFLTAFGPADVILEGYDIGAISHELVHTIPMPRHFSNGYSESVYAIAANRETVEEVIAKHELSTEQLLDQISEHLRDVRHASGDNSEPQPLRSQWIDDELRTIISLTQQVRTHHHSAPRV